MTTAPQTQSRISMDAPPAWANAWMRWALTTPVLQSMVGRSVALLTFTGRRTGRSYTVPVSYHRQDEAVTVITKRPRAWWHNFESPAAVRVRLAGHDYAGTARLDSDDDANLAFMTEYLRTRPMDAKAYGLAKEAITEEAVAALLPHLVVIRIDLHPQE
jgi:deazaflavin-dependent oxidoreductase (nitroreductase family)